MSQKMNRPFLTQRNIIILAGAMLLLILGAVGLYAFFQLDQLTTSSVDATMTVDKKVISTAFVAQSTSHDRTIASAQRTATIKSQSLATATATVIEATTIAQANSNPYADHTGTLVQDDSLHNNSTSDWDIGGNTNGSCGFDNGTYHARSSAPKLVFECPAHKSDYKDMVIQVQMTLLKGEGAGLSIRNNGDKGTGYDFVIYGDGVYIVFSFLNGQSTIALKSGTSRAIKQGFNQTNTIAVVAKGPFMDFYVNGQKIETVTHDTYPRGQIALVAHDFEKETEAAFTDLKVWTL